MILSTIYKYYVTEIETLYLRSFSGFFIITITILSRGFKQGQKSNQKNDQQGEPAQYQSQHTSNEIPDQEHDYEKPRPPTNETSLKHELEISAYEEVRENQFEEFQYQKIGEDGYLTPVFQKYPLPSVGAGN